MRVLRRFAVAALLANASLAAHANPFGFETYRECILDRMNDANTEAEVSLLQRLCDEEHRTTLPGAERAKLEGRAAPSKLVEQKGRDYLAEIGLGKIGDPADQTFGGTLYNGSAWYIAEIVVRVVTKEGFRDYRTTAQVPPLSRGSFSFGLYGTIPEGEFMSWSIIDALGRKLD